jgi:hypothetical protein
VSLASVLVFLIVAVMVLAVGCIALSFHCLFRTGDPRTAGWVIRTYCYSDDPRAYPGTQELSLESLVRELRFSLPPCRTNGVRYYSPAGIWGEDLMLTFKASSYCVAVFLESVGADESDKYVSTGDDVPISTPLVRQLGWDIDPHKMYDIYDARTSEVTSFDIVVDRNGQQPVVYLSGMRY